MLVAALVPKLGPKVDFAENPPLCIVSLGPKINSIKHATIAVPLRLPFGTDIITC